MKSVLDVPVSMFRGSDDTSNPKSINLLQWLTANQFSEEIKIIRNIPDKDARNKMKHKLLPVFTPGGEFSYRDSKKENNVSYSGLMLFDVDLTENEHIPNFLELKNEICNFQEVAYCGRSASGLGFWGLVAIAHPEQFYKEHFNLIYNTFESYCIKLDRAQSNIASTRYFCYDPDAYFNHNPKILTAYLKHKVTQLPFKRRKQYPLSHELNVEKCIRKICDLKMDITTGYSESWFPIGCDLASTFGENGRYYYHRVSQFYPSYSIIETDKQFDRCLSFVKGKEASLAVFFSRCKAHNIGYTSI